MTESVPTTTREQRAAPRWMPWVLAALAVFVLSFDLGARELSSPDEVRYAAIAWSMRETGDWLTPTHNFEFKHWHKPPLTYWLMASSFSAFGYDDWAARLPSALAGLAAVMGVYVIGRTMYGPRTGFLAGLILLASPLFFVLARLANTDMLLCAFVVWAWVCFVRSLFGEKRRALWFVLGGVFVGLGFMTKGPVVLLSTLAPMLLYLLLTNQWKRIGWWPWLAATGAFLVVGLPWYVIVCLKNPGLWAYFVEYQTVQRVATEIHKRTAPFWFFFWVVPLGFLPWIVAVPFEIWLSVRPRGRDRRADRQRALVLVCWFAVVLVLISVSTSKLATYCLPLFPALALLVGRHIGRIFETEEKSRVASRVALWLGLTLCLMSVFAVVMSPTAFGWAPKERLVLLHVLTAISFLAFGVVAVLVFRRGRMAIGVACVVAGIMCPQLLAARLVIGHEDDLGVGNPGNELAALICERYETIAFDKGVVPVMYRRYLKELPYYLDHPVLCLDCDVEFGYERPDGTKVSFYTDKELKALEAGYYRWNGRERLYHMMVGLMGRRLLVVTDRESYEDIAKDFVYRDEPLLHLIAEVGEFVICSNHPDPPAAETPSGDEASSEHSLSSGNEVASGDE